MTLAGLLRQARPWRGQLMLLILMMLAESLASLVVPWLLGLLAGGVLLGVMGESWPLVWRLTGLLALIAGLRILAGILAGSIGLNILAGLRVMVHDHVMNLPLAFHHDTRRGDLMSLMTWEIGRLSDYLTGTLVMILPAIVTAIGALILMAQISPMMTLVVPALIPLFLLGAKLFGRHLRQLSARMQEAEASMMARAHEALEILPAIKSFTREPETSAAYRASVTAARRAGFAELSAWSVLSPVTGFVTGSAAVLLLGFAGPAVAAGGLSATETISFMLYAALLTRPLAGLADVWGRTQATRGVLARLERVLALPVEQGGPGRIGRSRGEIGIRDLHYAWPGRAPLLRGLDLAVAAGECIAVTGANGAGKSTLTALLTGMMKPESGRITLDGTDIATLALRDLRQQFGHVPQRPLLFDGTLRDNIAFGLPGADEAQIEAAARAAQAHDFIMALPDGYDTRIGESGLRLSGGQSQRVALARALISDPPVLILDEATAMYDLEGESAFVEAARSAFAGRSVILITHRPATLALASRVVELRDGRLHRIRG